MAIADWLDIELFTVRRLQDRALGDSACDYVHRLMCGMSYVCRMARRIQDRPAALRTDAMVLVNEARSTTQLATLRAGACIFPAIRSRRSAANSTCVSSVRGRSFTKPSGNSLSAYSKTFLGHYCRHPICGAATGIRIRPKPNRAGRHNAGSEQIVQTETDEADGHGSSRERRPRVRRAGR